MTPERWRQVSAIYNGAIQCPDTRRAAYLADACGPDAALRHDVESLLSRGESFLAAGVRALPEGRLGPFVVIGILGAGGMGVVYRAQDTRLQRDVALKVLPDALAADPDRIARFTREAHLLASLNHPHIAAIYGLEQAEGIQALVLELVEGPTLADRIARGPIPLAEALPIARQIAEALEAAHEQGIIHRDLKPANVKVRDDGTVKVLDFGLAKALAPLSNIQSPDVKASPTLTSPVNMTGAGVILGTAAYMAPEQARGRTVDTRADIWAFGCVLFEMLAGRRPFAGHGIPDIVAAIVRDEPAWSALPSSTPALLRRLLQRCLQKDLKQRLQAIGDARIEIGDLISGATEPFAAPQASLAPPPQRRSVSWAAAIAALAVVSAVMLLLWAPWREAPPAAVTRVSVEIGVDASLPTLNTSAALALSPDGTLLAFTAQKGGASQLYLRRLGQLQSIPVAGTSGARDPFFSPDGQWVAFFADGQLKKISATGGGVAIALCDAPADRGGTWAEDHTIVFQGVANGPLFRVSDNGGTPTPLLTLGEGEFTQRWPQMLPGGKTILYTGHSKGVGFDDANVVVRPLPDGAPKVVQRGGYYGRYLASGHLVYIHSNTMYAAPFDLRRLEAGGSPVAVLEDVAANPIAVTPGAAAFAVSPTGVAVYLANQSARLAAPIEWMDRAGTATPLRTVPTLWSGPRFAPDGTRIAMSIVDNGKSDVWVYEWARDTMTRLTVGAGQSSQPVWTPDGRRIVFRSDRASGEANLYWLRADGSGEAQRLTESKNPQFTGSWHPDGKVLAFFEITARTGYDLMLLPMEGDEASGWKPGTPTPFLNTPATETEPMFSPDGQWIAYQSNESGRAEVYVRPFRGPGGKWQISTDGGDHPLWSRTQHELFFTTLDNRLMVASYAFEGRSFRADKPRLLANRQIEPLVGLDVHPDGTRFAAAVAAEQQAEARQDKVVFIFNFFDELRRLAPTKR